MSIQRLLWGFLVPFGLAIPVTAQQLGIITGTALNVVVIDHTRSAPISGRATFTEDSISFESSDVVFRLPADEIKAVEYKGTREEFLTFVLAARSKFANLYPFLCSGRYDAYHRREPLLVMSLAAKEPVDPSVKVAEALQGWIANRNEAAARAMVAPVNISAAEQAAHPFLGKTTRVVIGRIDNPITGTPAEFVSGLLTFFPERLEFNSRDLNFALPYASIEQVDCAGARETLLTIRIDPRDEFSKLYGKYRLAENYRFVPVVRFSLEMAEEVAPAYKTVQAFQRYMLEVLDARRSSLVGVVGNTGTITRSGPPEAAGAQGTVGRSPATVLLVLDAYYLEKRPGAIMTSLGTC